MQHYEYKVVPAPVRGEKARGIKTTADRFAHALTLLMNEQAASGWEYLRADTLPCEERTGLTGRTTTYQNMLTFRRPLTGPDPKDAQPVPPVLLAPADPAPAAPPAAPALTAQAPEASDSDTASDPVSAANRTLSLVSALKTRAGTARPVQTPPARPATGDAPPVGLAEPDAGSAAPPQLGSATRKD